ncbi:hypothetical protein [Rufibacter soli]
MVEALTTNFHLEAEEEIEANYLHTGLADKTDKLIMLWNGGQENEARQKFGEIESTGDQFMNTLSRLEQRVSRKYPCPCSFLL